MSSEDDDVTQIEIAIPNRNGSSEINAQLAKLITELQGEDDEDYKVQVNFSYLQPVDANRNKMVKEFLEDPDNDWLLMVDNDVVPPKDIVTMTKYDKPVVSGTVTIKKDHGVAPVPVILKRHGNNFRQVSLGEYAEDIDDETGLIQVDGVGTGCLLVRRDVLEDMKPPWFKFQYNEHGGLKLGEDFYFALKCAENDIPVYVSTEHECEHYKAVGLTEYSRHIGKLNQRIMGLEEELESEDGEE